MPGDVILMRRPLVADETAPAFPASYRLVAFESHLGPAAHALLAEAYADGSGDVPASDKDWWQAVSTDEEFDPSLCFLVVDDSGGPAAFALCWTSSFIKDIAVAATHRHRGLATALLGTIFAALAQSGHEEVRLKVHADNPSRAQDLYARLGFLAV